MKTNYCLCVSVIFLILSVGCATSDRPYSPSDLTGVKQVPSRTSKTAYRKQSVSQNQVRNSTAGYYVVKPGDTLYSVAFANNMDYQTLALINGIQAPYTINVGQRLLTDSVRSERKLYRVVKGDTVYNISKRYGLTPAQLASMNGIDKSFNIRIGQVLVVGKKTVNTPVQSISQGRAASSQSVPASASKQQTASRITTEKRNSSSAPAMSVASSGTGSSSSAGTGGRTSSVSSTKYQNVARNNARVNWRWPYNGKIIEGYSRNNKGIDISGNRGDSVRSAAKGKIVYAGNALRGYGNLIIINHDDDYLSAYAHNDAILVAEGQTVESGQVIARMGSTDAKSVRLHFEIRHNGESVNPLSYLPKK